MHLKMLSAKWRPFCPGEDELTHCPQGKMEDIFAEISNAFFFLLYFDSNVIKIGF